MWFVLAILAVLFIQREKDFVAQEKIKLQESKIHFKKSRQSQTLDLKSKLNVCESVRET